MRRRLLRRLTRNAESGDGARSITRRHFLATAGAAGVGLGTVGGRRIADSSGNDPASNRGGNAGAKTAGGRRSAPDGAPPSEDASTAVHEEGVDRSGVPADAPILGANLNGRPHRLTDNLELIDASDTSWVRAFIDVRSKLERGHAPRDDPDVVALRRVARERDCKLIVSLKWDFAANWRDKAPIRVPSPGSTDERELCRGAVAYLGSIGVPIDVVILGNEPMWETPGADIQVDDSPIVAFTRTVKEHLLQHGDHGDPTYLVGAFNRAHNEHTRTRQYPHFYRQMFELAREDEDIDGVDLHVHYGALSEAEAMIAFAREELPDGVVTVTEFSPVWRYDRHKDTPIAEFEGCEGFVRDHGLPASMTAVEYFEYAKRNPRPPEEVAALYEALPWYNENHVEDVYDLFAEYDVEVGTFGFMQGLGMRNEDWTRNWVPFHINFLFQPALIRTDDGIEHTANQLYLDDYRARAVRADAGSS